MTVHSQTRNRMRASAETMFIDRSKSSGWSADTLQNLMALSELVADPERCKPNHLTLVVSNR
ncbi:MAG: hypothetical protein AAGF28_06580 [Pseudomonadota bacterium]